MLSMYKKKIFLLLDKNDLNKLYEEMFPTNVLSFELNTGTNNILIPPKRTIFNIMPPLFKYLINYPCSPEYKSLVILNCDKPLNINLFKGFIRLNLTKAILASPLVADTTLYDVSPAI
jgi:hypothetical protein